MKSKKGITVCKWGILFSGIKNSEIVCPHCGAMHRPGKCTEPAGFTVFPSEEDRDSNSKRN